MKLLFAHLRNFFFKKRYVPPYLNKITLFTLLSIAAPHAFSASNVDKDTDGDGLSDLIEEKLGTEAYLSDTDGDGISDGIEVGNNVNKPIDSDKDKRIDALDYDDDNDGLPTILEGKNDTDKDGLKDYLDPDSDNDGLADGSEAGFLNQDKNFDGIDDAFDASRPGAVDKNGDGIDDTLKLPDHNNDGIADYLDPDYKNLDLIASKTSKSTIKEHVAIEPKAIAEKNENEKENLVQTSSKTSPAKTQPSKTSLKKKNVLSENTESKIQAKAAEQPKKAKIKVTDENRYTDTDNDGLLDSQELVLGTNIMKRDSDGDKVSDAVEVGMDINSPQDSDRDGIIDALDNDDDNDGILTKFEDINKDGTAINDDTDQDGVPNYLDANDDGDSRLTKVEGGTKDSDGDGILDYLDKNDGVIDKAPKVATKEKIPDEPEVVVLFDGDLSSLPPEEEESNDVVKQTIDSAVQSAEANGNLEEADQSVAVKKHKSEPQKVVLPEKVVPAKKTSSAEKEKGGIMQWLTSLLPD